MIRMGICIAAAMNVMIFSLAYYLGLAPEDGVVYELFGKINFLLAGIAVVVGGWPFMRSAVQGLRRRHPASGLPDRARDDSRLRRIDLDLALQGPEPRLLRHDRHLRGADARRPLAAGAGARAQP